MRYPKIDQINANIAETLRRALEDIRAATGICDAAMGKYTNTEEDVRVCDFLRETAGRLDQLANDGKSLSPADMRALAKDMARIITSGDPA